MTPEETARVMQSETIGTLVGALAKAQDAFEAAVKSAVNPHFKSRYAPLDVVIDATGPALRKNGLAVLQTFGADADGHITLRTTLAHSSGEWIAGEQVLLPSKNDPQGIAAASTYARRYGWQAIVGIAAEDDDGNAASAPAQGPGTRATNGGGRASAPVGGTRAEPAPSAVLSPPPEPEAEPAESHWGERIRAAESLDALGLIWAELGPWAFDAHATDPFHVQGAMSVFWRQVHDAAEVAIGDAETAEQLVAVTEHPLMHVAASSPSGKPTARAITALADKARRLMAKGA